MVVVNFLKMKMVLIMFCHLVALSLVTSTIEVEAVALGLAGKKGLRGGEPAAAPLPLPLSADTPRGRKRLPYGKRGSKRNSDNQSPDRITTDLTNVEALAN